MDLNSMIDRAPRRPRYESLDIWRGFACISVVAFHIAGQERQLVSFSAISYLIKKGSIGVPLFFVISGYCIAATCDSAGRKNRSLGHYMKRRINRIFPPYLISLVIIGIATSLGLETAGITYPFYLVPSQWFGNLTLTETWRPHAFGMQSVLILAPAWTLCYEEQFYLISGLLMVTMRRAFFSGVLVISILTIPLAGLSWMAVVDLSGFFFDGYWLHFAAGVLVYHGRNYAGKWGQRVSIGLLLSMAGLVTILRMKLPKEIIFEHDRPGFLTATITALAFAALLLIIERWDHSIYKATVLRPLRLCGVMCYSLYLIHQPVINGVRMAAIRLGLGGGGSTIGAGEAVVTLVCCVAAGWAFFLLVERHFLNSPTQRPPVPAELIPGQSLRASGNSTCNTV